MSAQGRADNRVLHVFAAGAVATALIATLTSFRSPPLPRAREVVRRPAGVEEGVAPTYLQEQLRHHANRLRHPTNFAQMASVRPALTDAVPHDEASWRAAIARRAERRAYDGAPPTIPHPIAQMAFPNCLTCHATGLRVGTRTAPAMCHDEHANCAQCHVVAERPMRAAAMVGGPPLENSFAGLEALPGGERAWPGAPPTIPHGTLMRVRCDSCHGVMGEGIRSTHPWRENCNQCHGRSAALDQRPLAELGPGPGAP